MKRRRKSAWAVFCAFVFLLAPSVLLASVVWVPSINLQVSDTTPLVCQGEDVCISITATDPDAGNTITITKISGAGTFNPVSGSSPLNAQHCFYPDTSGKYRDRKSVV